MARFDLNRSTKIPLYLQVMERVKHAIAMGMLPCGVKLPTIRQGAEALQVNPNTVARAYRDLAQAGFIKVKHGSGAFVSDSAPRPTQALRDAQRIVQGAITRLKANGLTREEIGRLVENELWVDR